MAINTITAPRTMSMDEMRADSATEPCRPRTLTVVLMRADLIAAALFLLRSVMEANP